MTYLFFKTETTGLLNYQVGPDDPSQPRLLGLSATLTNETEELAAFACLVQPEGFAVPPELAQVNGLTPEKLRVAGLPARTALNLMDHLAWRANCIIAFNFDFHDRILEIETLRQSVTRLPIKERGWDLQRLCAEAMGRPGGKPNLLEAYQQLVGKPLERRPFRLNDIYAMRHIWEAIGAKYPGLLPKVA